MVWEFVIHPNCILHGQGPKINEGPIGPVKSGMKHVCPSHIGDSSYSPLSNPILMMGTHTTKTYVLAKFTTVRAKVG